MVVNYSTKLKLQNVLERNYLKLYPKDSANHILFANLYSKANLFEKRKEILDQMKQKKTEKKYLEYQKLQLMVLLMFFMQMKKIILKLMK